MKHKENLYNYTIIAILRSIFTALSSSMTNTVQRYDGGSFVSTRFDFLYKGEQSTHHAHRRT